MATASACALFGPELPRDLDYSSSTVGREKCLFSRCTHAFVPPALPVPGHPGSRIRPHLRCPAFSSRDADGSRPRHREDAGGPQTQPLNSVSSRPAPIAPGPSRRTRPAAFPQGGLCFWDAGLPGGPREPSPSPGQPRRPRPPHLLASIRPRPPSRLPAGPARRPRPSPPPPGACRESRSPRRSTASRSEFHLERRAGAIRRGRSPSALAAPGDRERTTPLAASPQLAPPRLTAAPRRERRRRRRRCRRRRSSPACSPGRRGGRGRHEGLRAAVARTSARRARHVGRRGSQCAWPRRLVWG